MSAMSLVSAENITNAKRLAILTFNYGDSFLHFACQITFHSPQAYRENGEGGAV